MILQSQGSTALWIKTITRQGILPTIIQLLIYDCLDRVPTYAWVPPKLFSNNVILTSLVRAISSW